MEAQLNFRTALSTQVLFTACCLALLAGCSDRGRRETVSATIFNSESNDRHVEFLDGESLVR